MDNCGPGSPGRQRAPGAVIVVFALRRPVSAPLSKVTLWLGSPGRQRAPGAVIVVFALRRPVSAPLRKVTL